MTTATLQTLGAGVAQPQVWAASLAGVQNNKPRPLTSLQGMIIGPFGNGKSCLLQSNPDCFIVNADRFSSHVESPKAAMWPNPGDAVAFPDIQEKVKQLVRLAREKKDRPAMVGLDSVSGLLDLAKSHLTAKAGKDSWADMDRKAWYQAYDMILALRRDLRAAGYGVYFVAGLDKKVINMGQDVMLQAVDWPFSPTLATDLLGLSEIVIPITVDWTSEVVERKTVWTGKRLIAFDDPTMTGVAKAMGISKRIPIDKETGWQSLTEAYNAANKLS